MKTFLVFTLSLLSFSALATCPTFESLYTKCSSSSGFAIDSISTKSRPPFYSFVMLSGTLRTRTTIVTDGEPRDITIQTQDGSEATYSEEAYCEEGKLIVIRSSEETTDTDERTYEAHEGHLKISHSQNGHLKEIVNCHL